MAKLLIVGAGFSRFAGLPLGNEIFSLVLNEARKDVIYDNILRPELERFCLFKQRTEGVALGESEVDLEEFVSFLDVEHFLRFKGSDVYADEGDRSQLAIKNCVARVIFDRQEAMSAAQWQPYEHLASQLAPGDWVISFNYDTILETAFERRGISYRLVPDRFKSVYAGGGELDPDDNDVVIAKVHGSIDWFDIAFWEADRRYFANFDFPIRDRHPIFSRPEIFLPSPIVGEPYLPESPLRRVRRVQNLEKYFSAGINVLYAPLLLSPSWHKLLYSDPLKELWRGIRSGGSWMEQVTIIGFSMPPHDQYTVQALYSICRNFQNYDTDGLVTKGKLRFVDWCPRTADVKRLKKRYRFVNWRRAEVDPSGFRPEAVNFVLGL